MMMTAIKNVSMILGIGVGILAAALAASILIMGLSYQHNIWYFPGDPPYLDISFLPAVMSLLINLVLFYILRRPEEPKKIYRLFIRINRPAFFASIILAGICISGIAFRFTPAWRDVRAGIKQYGDKIAADAGDKVHVMSDEEFTSLKAKHLPTPIPLSMPGYGTVHLRMASGIYPYVVVDFGNGQNAMFDPRTMICTYSD